MKLNAAILILAIAIFAAFSLADEPLRKPTDKDDSFVVHANLQELIRRMAKENEDKNGDTTEKEGVTVGLLKDVTNKELQEGQAIASALLSSAPDQIPEDRISFYEKLIGGHKGEIEIIGWQGTVTFIDKGDEGKLELSILWRPVLKSKGGVAFIGPSWEERWELTQGEEAFLTYKSGAHKKGALSALFID